MSKRVGCHLFLKVVPEVDFKPEDLNDIVKVFGSRYGRRMWQLNVFELELDVKFPPSTILSKYSSVPIKVIVQNPTGQKFNVDAYTERKDLKGNMIYQQVVGKNGPLDQKATHYLYSLSDKIHKKRILCKSLATTYAYDFLELFEESTKKSWEENNLSPPRRLMQSVELILSTKDANSQDLLKRLGLEETNRPMGQNNIGIVAWKVKIFTPECQHDEEKEREFILIANDLTFQGGSFALEEDELFLRYFL